MSDQAHTPAFTSVTDLYAYALEHDGVTVTADLSRHSDPSDGRYIVGVSRDLDIPLDASAEDREDQLDQLVEMAKTLGTEFVGLWIEHGRYCGNASVCIEAFDEAAARGRANGQEAIYDQVEQKTIWL